MSLLLANGHSQAPDYPIGMVHDEATLVVERMNGLMGTAAVLVQAAGASVVVKEGGKHFQKLLKQITGD